MLNEEVGVKHFRVGKSSHYFVNPPSSVNEFMTDDGIDSSYQRVAYSIYEEWEAGWSYNSLADKVENTIENCEVKNPKEVKRNKESTILFKYFCLGFWQIAMVYWQDIIHDGHYREGYPYNEEHVPGEEVYWDMNQNDSNWQVTWHKVLPRGP